MDKRLKITLDWFLKKHDAYDKFYENKKKLGPYEVPNKFSNCIHMQINNAFNWGEAKEGFNYWDELFLNATKVRITSVPINPITKELYKDQIIGEESDYLIIEEQDENN